MMKRLSRQLRELMVPRKNALLLAQADAARDDGAWSTGAELYRQFVRLHPDRNGLWMQSGHCLKEMGCCRTALFDYLAVSHEEDRPEADFHAGVLLKHTGNSTAAKWAFARSAARGHALSVSELDRLARGETVLRLGFFERAVETGEDETRVLERLFTLELTPLDWRRLAAAAEDAAIRGFAEPAHLLADLALIIGGPVAERQLPYTTILSASGLWGDRYTRHLGSPVFASMKPAEALRRLIDTLDFDTPLADQRFGGGGLASQEANLISIVDADGGEDATRLRQAAAAIAVIKDRLFREKEDGASGLVEAIVALAVVFPAKGRPIYAALPEQGGYSLAAILQRVCLNVIAAIADRLAAQLRIAPAAVAASFAVPTARATLATCAASDTVPAVVALEARSDDPAAQQKLSELTALGLIPDGGLGAAERLLALAEQGRQAPMEYWFSVSAPTAPPSLVGEVAIRVANALKGRGAATQALLWTERAAAAVPERYTMDLGIQRKTIGDFAGAATAFSWVLTHEPAHESASWELNSVVRECLSPREIAALVKEHPGFGALYLATEEEERQKRAQANARTAPNTLAAVLDIADLRDTLDFGLERLECHQIGWLRSEVGGKSFPRLVGVVAIRLCHVTRDQPQRLRLRLNGRTIDIVAPSPGGIDSNGIGKYHFNSWVDTRDLPRGPARLQAYVEQKSSGYSIFEETVVIDDLKPGRIMPAPTPSCPRPAKPSPGQGWSNACWRCLRRRARPRARPSTNRSSACS